MNVAHCGKTHTDNEISYTYTKPNNIVHVVFT